MTEAAASPHITDSSDQAFMTDVVEASNEQPVLVDFWAPWCGPCRTLTPTLEKVVGEQNGKVKLVKINTEEHPGVAGQMGVRSIPSVFAFDKGRPVNGFQGALPESQVRQFIESVLGGTDNAKQLQEALEQAEAAAQGGDIGAAAQLYGAVMEADPENAVAIAGLARCYLANGDHDRARQILDMVPENKANEAAVKSVRTALELIRKTIRFVDSPRNCRVNGMNLPLAKARCVACLSKRMTQQGSPNAVNRYVWVGDCQNCCQPFEISQKLR